MTMAAIARGGVAAGARMMGDVFARGSVRRALQGHDQVVCDARDRNLVADIGLDIHERERILVTGETHRFARGPGARGPPYAMHIILGVLGEVVIKDVAHIWHMQAPRRDVGGDQYRETPPLEIREQALALLLRDIPGKHRGLKIVGGKPPLHALGDVLGVGEHERPRHLLGAQQPD